MCTAFYQKCGFVKKENEMVRGCVRLYLIGADNPVGEVRSGASCRGPSFVNDHEWTLSSEVWIAEYSRSQPNDGVSLPSYSFNQSYGSLKACHLGQGHCEVLYDCELRYDGHHRM